MTPPPAAGRPRPAPASLRRVVRAVLCVLCVVLGVAICAPARSAPNPRWQWPIPAPHEVVEVFDAPDQPYGAGHRGIDIAVDGPGAEVRAVEVGTVRFAGAVAGRGVVSVLHADGLISTYEPVQASVQQGQKVDAGDVLGTVAPESATGSHCTEVLCLHLGARRGQEYLDPLLLLGERGPSVRQHRLADPGQLYRPAGTVEQPVPQLPLQLADLGTHSGLAQVQQLGRPGEAAVLGDGDEVLELPEFHNC